MAIGKTIKNKIKNKRKKIKILNKDNTLPI